MSLAIAEAITTFTDAEQRFSLTRTEAAAFFSEWCTDLPPLDDRDEAELVAMRRRYLYQRSEGHLFRRNGDVAVCVATTGDCRILRSTL